MTVAAFIVLVVALVAMNVNSARVIRRLRAASRTALVAKTDDEDVLAVLEAHAATSDLARRLLAGAQEGEELAEKAASLVWQHDPDTNLPSEEHWKLLWRDYQTEQDDTARVVAIARYLDAGNRFTMHEQVMLIEAVGDEGLRDEARRLLFQKSNADIKGVWAGMYHLMAPNHAYWDLIVGYFVNEDEVRGKLQGMVDDRIKKEGLTAPSVKITVTKL